MAADLIKILYLKEERVVCDMNDKLSRDYGLDVLKAAAIQGGHTLSFV